MPERTFTTHDIAKICDVYPSSVVNWISAGRLKSYSTPGGHHRVTREDLLSFLEEFEIPVPREVRFQPARALIVDDDPEFSRVAAKAFAKYGAEFIVETSSNGIDALIRIGQDPPDVVVLDIVLPGMDGLQVCKILKSKPETRAVKIVAVTGKKSPFGDRNPAGLGIDAFYKKPLDFPEMIGRCAELLAASRAAAEKAAKKGSAARR